MLVAGTVASCLLALYRMFNLGHLVGYVAIENRYFYAVLAVLLPLAFILFPAGPTA